MKGISKFKAAELIFQSNGAPFQVTFKDTSIKRGIRTAGCKTNNRYKPAVSGTIKLQSSTSNRHHLLDLDQLLEIEIAGEKYTIDKW